MTSEQIRSLGPALDEFLVEFDDCFLTGETRGHLREYVKGQLSDLPRKSVEPMAELAEVPARTLQEFLSLSDWDHGLARDQVQRIVARDHCDANAIGIVDESGHPKKGTKKGAEHVTVCQVRTAAEALLSAWLMAGAARQQRIDRAAAKIQRTQRHNAAACVSHTKARRRKLRAMGIRVERLTSCHPP